jgi:putative chitinase
MKIREITEDISRRGFLSGLAGAAATAATGAYGKQTPNTPQAHPVPMDNPNVQTLLSWAKQYIKDPSELAAFMSQCAHESLNFTKLSELGDPERFLRKYDIQYNPHAAKKLGNTTPGDGPKYKGRGFLQITGKWNYEQATKWVNKLLASMGINKTVDFVNNPDMVATPTAGALASLWYWETFSKHHVKDFRNTKQVTKSINPGLKGEKEREAKTRDWQAALNVPKLPKMPHHHGQGVRVASR